TTAAELAQTTAEVVQSPWLIRNRVKLSHNLKVTINHDPKDFEFPATATHYRVRAAFAESDAIEKEVTLPATTQSAPLEVSFDDVPSGGTVDVSVKFYSKNDWVAGVGSKTGTLNITPSGSDALNINLTIQERLVPLTASSQYNHKEKLAYTGGNYEWSAGAAPTQTKDDLNSTLSNGALGKILDVSVNETNGLLSYGWQSYSANFPECGNSSARGQLYQHKTVSLTQNPSSQLKDSSCGTTEILLLKTALFDDSSAGNFALVPGSNNEYFMRKFSLDSSNTYSFSSGSYGKFALQMDSMAIHPSGTVFCIRKATGKIFHLHLVGAAVADSESPLATPLSGPASSVSSVQANPSLLLDPVAVAAGPKNSMIILDRNPSSANGDGYFRSFDLAGNPLAYFGGGTLKKLNTNSQPVTYLDMSIEAKGYIYVLSYLGTGSTPSDYQLEIYTPDGNFLAKTTSVSAGAFSLDAWRNVYTVNYESITGAAGKTEPSVSQWIPST
ncbi:MAG: hypothetical protein KDD66_08225, partial [Bdellovibrionales bacterium]|nr:hypothetical protein [Bdellovibrionales bacterium]